MPSQPEKKLFKITCARNLRTGTVEWDKIVEEFFLVEMRRSGEWKLVGVKKYDGTEQDTLEELVEE